MEITRRQYNNYDPEYPPGNSNSIDQPRPRVQRKLRRNQPLFLPQEEVDRETSALASRVPSPVSPSVGAGASGSFAPPPAQGLPASGSLYSGAVPYDIGSVKPGPVYQSFPQLQKRVVATGSFSTPQFLPQQEVAREVQGLAAKVPPSQGNKQPNIRASAPQIAVKAPAPVAAPRLEVLQGKEAQGIAAQVSQNKYAPQRDGGVVISPNGQVTRINPRSNEQIQADRAIEGIGRESVRPNSFGSVAGLAARLGVQNMQNRQAAANQRAQIDAQDRQENRRINNARLSNENARLEIDRERLNQDSIGVAMKKSVNPEGIGTVEEPVFYSKKTGQRINDAASPEMSEDDFVKQRLADPYAKNIQNAEAKARKAYQEMYLNGRN